MNFFHNIEHNFTHFNSPAHIFNIAPPPIAFKPLQPLPPPHTIPPFKPPIMLPPFIMPPPHMIQLQPKEQHTEQPQPQPPQVAPVAVVDNTTQPATQSTFSNFLESDSSYILYGIAGLGIIIYVFNKQ
jgi:hypothetical protein